MASSSTLFVTLFVLLTLTQLATSLKCYNCGTDVSGECGDGFNQATAHSETCAEEQVECYKIVFSPQDSHSTVHRGCSIAGICDSDVWECKSCTEDLCNSA